MPHSMYVGITESGKSTLAQKIAAAQKARNIRVLVLDPLRDPRWCGEVYTSQQDFLHAVFSCEKCDLFIDESGEMIGRYSGVMKTLATRSRHYGHNAHFILQRPSDLDRTIRDQCTRLFVFRVSKYDSEILARDYSEEKLNEAYLLKKGEYLETGSFRPCIKKRVF